MRWKPTRAGILNVWEYDDQEFDFGDGRLVLRGRNGSGKSNALALLCPFLLDGVMSAARMDPMGGSRSMKSLLLGRDDTEGGSGRYRHDSGTGYVWMEFSDGAGHLTVGIGAAATAHRDADPWFFVTPERVGYGLDLTESDVPLGRRRLIERLGDDAVSTKADDHRRCVDRHLFGLGTARYRSMVDLLLELRRPHLATRFDAEGLSARLSTGLGEVDTSLIDDVAHSFDDLDAMQDELEGLAASLDAVERFLPAYRDHLVAIGRGRATHLVAATDGLRSIEREQRSTDTELAEAREASQDAGSRLAEAQAEKRELDGHISDILVSPAYQSATALDEVAKSADAAAEHSEVAAERSRSSAELTDRADERRRAAEAEFGGRRDELIEATRNWIEAAGSAGIDAAFTVDSFDDDRAVAVLVERTAKVNEIRVFAEASAQAASRALQAAEVAEIRRTEAALAAIERDEAAGEVRAQRSALDEAWSTWWDSVTELVERLRAEDGAVGIPDPVPVAGPPPAGPSAGDPDDDAAHGPGAGAGSDAEDPALARFHIAERWLGRLDPEAARLLERALHLVDQHDELLGDLTEERERVETEPNPGPPPDPTRPGAAADGPGVPLYVCVDFADGIDEPTRAGIESALDAAGILDARIGPDDRAFEGFDAVLASDRGGAETGLTLADLLVATPTEALDAERITQVLKAVPLDGEVVELHDDGSWRLGPLAGRYLHDEPRYIGHASRERRRAERLAELDELIRAAESELADRRSRAERVSELRLEIDRRRADQPATAPLAHAIEDMRRSSQAAQHAHALHTEARRASDDAATAAEQAGTELHRRAVAARLPTAPGDIDSVKALLVQLDRQLEAVAGRRRACSDAQRRLEDSEREHREVQDRSSGDHASAAELAEHARLEAARYEDMRSNVGGDAEAAVERLSSARRKLTAIEARTDELHGRQRDAENAGSQLAERLRGLEARHTAAAREVTTTGAAFDVVCAAEIAEILAVDGVESGGDAHRAARRLLAGTTEPSEDATNRMERAHREILLDGLRAGHDPSMPKVDGIDVVRVGTAEGELPIGALARQLRDEHERTSQLLSKQEREIFETHLLTRIGDSLRTLLLEADTFEHRINSEMARAPTESGMVVELKWEVTSDEPGMADAVRSLRTSPDMLGPERRESLREFFMARIADLRSSDPGRSFAETLTTALDYRSWHTFSLFARFSDGQRSKVTRKFYRGLSGGEAASLLHLPLFAAAAAQYSSGAVAGPRLIALDEAFVGIDDRMRARLMGLLTQLDLDVVLTSHEFWGFYETVPALVGYDLVRRPPMPGVHAQRFEWSADSEADHGDGATR